MATSASKKKQKKPKGKTLALTDFLADEKGGPAPSYVPANKALDWAAEMENQESNDDLQDIEYGGGRSHFDRSVLPTAPKAARGPDVDMDRIPSNPPFTAFIGNLPYEASEERIEEFFKKLKVVNVRLPTDQGRLRGFGYVEFEDRESLIEALTMNDSIFSGRKIRVDLAGQNQQGGDRGSSDHRRSDEPDRTDTDWRRRDPETSDRGGDRYGDRDGGRGFGGRDGGRFGDRYGDRDGGRSYGDRDGGRYGDRDGGGRYGDRDGGGRYGDRDGGGRYGDRDGGGRYGDRDGGGRYGDRNNRYGDRDGGGRYGGDRYGGDRYGDRDQGRYGGRNDRYSDRYGDRDGDRYGGGSRGFSDRDGDRRGFGSGFRSGDRDDRYGNRDRGYDRPSSRETSQEAPKERPRLQLQPRTKPVEQSEPGKEERKSSIFGSAKPVDTSARDREIEERLQRERELTSQRFDEEKENRNYDNRREVSTGSRTRKDSDRSDGGSKRERRLSSSSGKGVRPGPPPVTTQRSRRDSELSNHSDVFSDEKEESKQPMSPKKEESSPKLVDAPPPKENAWSKRPSKNSSPGSQSSEPRSPPAESSTSPPNAWSKGRPDQRSDYRDGPRHQDRDRHPDYRGPGHNERGRGRGRGMGRGERGHGSDKKTSREKHIPQSIEEMPKYEEKVKKDWSDKNKYSFLMDDEEETS